MDKKTQDRNKNKQNIDDIFSAEKIKAFQDDIKKEMSDSQKTPSAISGTTKTEKRGRKNRGLTELHQQQYLEYRNELLNTQSKPTAEHVNGEIIKDDDIESFRELYQLTCETVLENFKAEHSELIKRHPYNWYKKLLIELKKNVPEIHYNELERLQVAWDCLTWLMNDIGLYITFETFSLFTHVYKYQLEKMKGVNPKYIDFCKKISNERDDALKNELLYSPYNSTNKIFMAKVNGIIEKTEPKQIEITHTVRQYDNLPMFSRNLNEISTDQ